jgi:hypothetical protein
VELIEFLAKKRPYWNFVLIGRVYNPEVNKLKMLDNVYLLDEQPYRDLPKYLYHFDVCIIPFKKIN